MDNLEELNYYVTTVYAILKTEFLEAVKGVSDRYLAEVQSDNASVMTGSYYHEPEVAYFAQYVSQTAWNILNSQGYNMDQLVTFFTEMWTQEHKTGSYMETHVHPRGAQISAFYFLDVPPDSCQIILHDPRPAKVMINLFPKDDKVISGATDPIVLSPQPGMLIFTNSWLPHSFSQNRNELPCRFVHMNLSVMPAPAKEPDVEIV